MNYLWLKNDGVNSFDKVRAALIYVCKHDVIQAEQCCIIAHNLGKVVVKQGDFMDLLNMQQKLTKIGLDVELNNEKELA
jgi:ATP-dependent Clp protease adaptor protein ClpS